MPNSSASRSVVCVLVLSACASASRAIDTNSFDNFENGTISGWAGGDTLSNSTPGPAGAADHFLRAATHAASGSGSAVATLNTDARWTGNYTTANITAIECDMINLGSSTLEMRLVLFGLGSSTSSRYTSTQSVSLAAGTGWKHVTFPINQSALTLVLGSLDYTSSMANVTTMMFRNDVGTPSSGGTTAQGTIGIDNIRAVPAPGSLAVLGLCACVIGKRRRPA